MSIRFGTDGVRGEAGVFPIDAIGAMHAGWAAGRWAAQVGDRRVLVGRDTRPSGPALAEAVLQGAVRAGAAALDAGVLPTPGVQAALAAGLADVGVMVTASHNPAADNGFKILGPGGIKPDDAAVAHLEVLLAEAMTGCGGPVQPCPAAATAYADALARAAGDLGPLAGRRLLVDLAAGAAVGTAEVLRRLLPSTTLGFIGTEGVINDGVGSEHPAALAAAVRAGGWDAGLAVDGDGDRGLLVDAGGEVVPGDALLGLLAADAGARVLVVTVMSSTALEAALPGVEVVRTAVGDRHVAHAMRARGAAVGGEESGHVLFAGPIPGGDGVLTGLRALAAAWRRAPTVAAAMAPFRPWPRRLTKVKAADRRDVTAAVAPTVAAATARLAGGRVFIRWSGTEPVLRVLVEGPDAGVVEAESAAVTAACAAALA